MFAPLWWHPSTQRASQMSEQEWERKRSLSLASNLRRVERLLKKNQMGSSSMNCLVAVCTPLMTMKARFSFRLHIVCCDFRWWSFSFRLPLLFISVLNWLKKQSEIKKSKCDQSKDYEYIQIYRFAFIFYFYSLIKNYNYFSSLLLPDDHEIYFFFLRRILCFIHIQTLTHIFFSFIFIRLQEEVIIFFELRVRARLICKSQESYCTNFFFSSLCSFYFLHQRKV